MKKFYQTENRKYGVFSRNREIMWQLDTFDKM